MKRKRFTALKVTLTAMMLTAALTSGAGSAYAVDLSQEGGSEPTVTMELQLMMDITRLKEFFICLIRMHRE